jgi:hypothetical protein
VAAGAAVTEKTVVIISQAIVHQVYDEAGKRSRPDEPPFLSGSVTSLDSDVADFLSDHIATSQDDHRARRGIFNQPDQNVVLAACDRIFADPTSEAVFVEESRTIARRLFESMRGRAHMDSRISTGNLVVCSFELQAARDGGRTPMIAVLKIDPQVGFVGDITRGPGDTERIVLRRIGDVLTDTRLQKCAFILPPTVRDDDAGHVIVLDLQTERRNTGRWAASYFVQKFLDCTVGLSSEEQIETFIYESDAWIDGQGWDEAVKLHVKDQVVAATYNPRVDIVAFADQVIDAAADREAYLDHLRDKGLNDLSLRLDPTRKRRLAEFVTFEGDNELRLRVKRADYGLGRRVAPTVNADGSVTIQFRTARWREQR